MAEYTTDEIRDGNTGKVTAIRITAVDALGRSNFADIPVDQLDVIPSQGTGHAQVVGFSAVVAAVAAQVVAALKPSPQSAGPGPVLTLPQVQAIARKIRGK